MVEQESMDGSRWQEAGIPYGYHAFLGKGGEEEAAAWALASKAKGLG